VSKPNAGRIPFEPNNRSKKTKEAPKPSSVPVAASKPTGVAKNTINADRRDSLGIPDEVNRRIMRRVAVFCGIPTGLGISTFIVSYLLVSKHIADLPTSAVVLLSMLFLGIGVVGLSYGAISASWDEGRIGSWWGGEEFKTNFGHLRGAWKSQQQLVKANQESTKTNTKK
jgi:hypothetical protein